MATNAMGVVEPVDNERSAEKLRKRNAAGGEEEKEICHENENEPRELHLRSMKHIVAHHRGYAWRLAFEKFIKIPQAISGSVMPEGYPENSGYASHVRHI